METGSAARIRAAIGGSVFLTLFGAAWIVSALANWAARPAWGYAAASVVTLGLLASCVVRLRNAGSRHASQAAIDSKKAQRTNRTFGLIFGIEGVSIALCCAVLSHFALDDWIPIAIATIVGAHFLPLARVFAVPFYNVTGVLCMASMLGCAMIPSVDARLLAAGLAMGIVLWFSVIAILVMTKPTPANARP